MTQVRADDLQRAVIYQVCPQSFSDSDGDGIGDIGGIIDRLGYLELLGVDALWLTSTDDNLDDLANQARHHSIALTALNAASPPHLVGTTWDASDIRSAITEALRHTDGTLPTWCLSTPDSPRETARYGDDGSSETGIRRARAMALVELALPGAAVIASGAELGLPADQSPGDRPGNRAPLPWEGTAPPFGFSSTDKTWLPIPPQWAHLTVEAQLEDLASTLSLYRQAIEYRRTRTEFVGDEVDWYGAPSQCLAFRRSQPGADGGQLVCVLNASNTAVGLPAGDPLLTSSQLDNGQLPPDSAAWLITNHAS